jgi:hypothetical protein
MADTQTITPDTPAGKPPSKVEIGDAIGQTIRLVRSNLKTLVTLSLLFGLLNGAVGIAEHVFSGPDSSNPFSDLDPDNPPVALFVAIFIAIFVLVIGLFAYAQNVILHVFLDVRDSGGVGPGTALKLGLAGLPGMAAVTLLYYGGAFLFMLLLLLPGIWFSVVFAVVRPVKLAEGCGIFEAFGIARGLTRGSRWSILGVWVLVWLMVMAALLVAQLVIVIFGFFVLMQQIQNPSSLIPFAFLAGLASAFLQILAFSFFAATDVVLYRMLTRSDAGLSPRQTAAVFD